MRTLRVRRSLSLSTMKLLKKLPMEASTALAQMSFWSESTDPMGPMGTQVHVLHCLILLSSCTTPSPPKAFMGISVSRAHAIRTRLMQAIQVGTSLLALLPV